MSRKLTTEEFIRRSSDIHKSKYSYERVVYQDNKTHVEVTCPEHGYWRISPSHHIIGKGCPKCADVLRGQNRTLLAANSFISSSKIKHGDRYTYDNVEYISAQSKVKITCKVHGEFLQTPNSHLGGQGCPHCAKELIKRQPLTTEDFIRASEATHADKYDYTKSVYTRCQHKVEIICKKHGSFWQSASAHMAGKGCQKCMKTGYQENKPGYLYVLRSENITKVGITNRLVSKRAKDVSKDSGRIFFVDFYINFSDGRLPKAVETDLLSFLRNTYDGVTEPLNGFTECFWNVNQEELFLKISELCSKHMTKEA